MKRNMKMETGMKMKVILGNGIETERVISLGVDNGNENRRESGNGHEK